MEYQIIWFVLWSVLWAVYFMLDGFDFGVGILSPFLGKDKEERHKLLHTLGPVWSGNEVWLITAGGATFAAFPTTYALMFSYLYTPLLLILFALIVRGVAMEFREMMESDAWRSLWDNAIAVSSFLPALLFGVAFGNIFEGLPMDAEGYHGSLFTLLNPYGILTGLLFVLLFLTHGALWAAYNTHGELSARARDLAGKLWLGLLPIAVIFLAYTKFATNLYANFLAHPVWFIVPLLAVAGLLGIRLFIARNALLPAFAASSVTILTVVGTGVIGLYPNLIPSSLDPNSSLTIFNSSSSLYTLKIMTVVAFIFVPLVIIYQFLVYKLFVRSEPDAEELY